MIPNILTGFRILLVIPILAVIGKDPRATLPAAMLFLVAVLTDFLDGQAARRLNQQSTFGAMFDLTADRLVMTPTLIMIYAHGLLNGARDTFPGPPLLYVILIVGADITTLIGIYMYIRLHRSKPEVQFPSPTLIVKSAYPVQASVVFFTLLQLKGSLIGMMMCLSVVFTLAAIVSYTRKGGFIFSEALKVMIEESRQMAAEDEESDAANMRGRGGSL